MKQVDKFNTNGNAIQIYYGGGSARRLYNADNIVHATMYREELPESGGHRWVLTIMSMSGASTFIGEEKELNALYLGVMKAIE